MGEQSNLLCITVAMSLIKTTSTTLTVTAYDGTGIVQQQPLTLGCNYTNDGSDVIDTFEWRHEGNVILSGSVTYQNARFQSGTGWESGVFLGDNTSSLTIQLPVSSVTPSIAGQYTCVVSSLTGGVWDTATATVQYAPNIESTFPSSRTVTEFSRLQIDCSRFTTPGNPQTTSYTWTYGGSTISSVAVLDINNIGRDRRGQYTCTASNTVGSDSETVSVDVQYAPNIKSTFPTSRNVTEFSRLQIDCSSYTTPGNPQTTSYTWAHVGGSTISSGAALDINNIGRDRRGQYTCTASNTVGRINANVTVHVQYAPNIESTFPSSRTVTEFSRLQIDCSTNTTPGNPPTISYTWTYRGSTISSVAVLDLNNIGRDRRGQYTCTASNTVGSDSETVSVDVQYGPGNSVQVTPEGTTALVEGSGPFTATCTADCNPDCSISWRSDTRNLNSVSISNVSRTDQGNYTCQAQNKIGGPREKTITLVVNYRANISEFSLNSAAGPVTVSEGEKVTLRCQVDSNPPATIRLLNGSQELKRGDNSLSVTDTWHTTCRQRGNYSCNASNSVEPAAVSDLKLTVECSPRPDETFPVKYQSASQVGSSVTLWMSVLSYPVPTFTWSRSKSSSQDLSGSLSDLSDISVNISLTLTSLRREDFGLYNLTVSNEVGNNTVTTFEVVPKGPPVLPTDVQVREITHNSALVSWTRGFNGGEVQHFTVSYSTDNTTWMNSSKIEENEKTDYYDIVVSNLNPSTFYSVRVIAGNEYGESNYTEAVLLVTKTAPKATSGNTALIGGVTGGCTALLLIAICVGGIYMYRRNKGQKDPQNGPSSGRSREDLVIQENDLYGRSSGQNNAELVIEENVCYVSSGEVGGGSRKTAGGATGGLSDVYAVIDKKPKPGEAPSEPTQVKPKKAAKPGKKDGEKKKKVKDDTIPLTKQKQNKRGDVYENTSPGQFLAEVDANTYANAGFVGDDHTREGTAAVQAPQTGRDADGCLYVGIDFSNQKPGKVIIGEERSPYADIAYGKVGPSSPPDEEEEKKKDAASK